MHECEFIISDKNGLKIAEFQTKQKDILECFRQCMLEFHYKLGFLNYSLEHSGYSKEDVQRARWRNGFGHPIDPETKIDVDVRVHENDGFDDKLFVEVREKGSNTLDPTIGFSPSFGSRGCKHDDRLEYAFCRILNNCFDFNEEQDLTIICNSYSRTVFKKNDTA